MTIRKLRRKLKNNDFLEDLFETISWELSNLLVTEILKESCTGNLESKSIKRLIRRKEFVWQFLEKKK